MTKSVFIIIALLLASTTCIANTFTENANTYPVESDGKKFIVSGFVPISGQNDETIFANAILWVVENICPQLREGIENVDVAKKKFTCDMALSSMPGSGIENTYYLSAQFSVASGKLIYYLSDIRIESKSLVFKKITPLEKLNPEKKESHKEAIDDFVASESATLNAMFDFITENKPIVSHWNEIGIRKPIEGMTTDECLIAFGKPKTTFETNGEVQWMYSTSFILFFRDGKVCTILR